jgi:hypothetical protein
MGDNGARDVIKNYHLSPCLCAKGIGQGVRLKAPAYVIIELLVGRQSLKKDHNALLAGKVCP